MIDIQAKIRHQALTNAAALKEVEDFVERISKKDEETTHAATTFDPSTVKIPPVRYYEIPLDEEKSGLYTAEEYKCVGNRLFGERKFEKALDYYECAGRVDPTMAAAFGNAGLCYQKLNRIDEALASFSRAIEIDQTYTKILVRRGRIYLMRENYDAAYSDLTLALTLLPEKGRQEVQHDLDIVKSKMSAVPKVTATSAISATGPDDTIKSSSLSINQTLKGKSIAIDMSCLDEAAESKSPVGSPKRPVAVQLRDTKRNIPSNRDKPSIPLPPTSSFSLYNDVLHLCGHIDLLAEYLNSFHSAVLESYLSSQMTDKEVKSLIAAIGLRKLSAKKTINTLYALTHLPNLSFLSPFLSEETKATIRDTLEWALHQIPEEQMHVYDERNDEVREAFCL